jgi:hypothetical protein
VTIPPPLTAQAYDPVPAAAAAGDAAAGPWAEVPPTLREAAGAAAGAELSRVVEFPAQVRLGGGTWGDARGRKNA